MRADIATRLKRARIALATGLLGWLVEALGRTWRIEVVEGREHLNALQAGDSPAILAFWHDQVIVGAYYTGTRMARKGGVDVTALTSRSGDGELVARIMHRWGARIVRGSSSAGGREAMWKLRTVVRRHGSSPIMVPDGPRGPARHLKRGILVLARVSGAPVLALGFAADRHWRLNSWDRMIIPRPFARVRLLRAPLRNRPPIRPGLGPRRPSPAAVAVERGHPTSRSSGGAGSGAMMARQRPDRSSRGPPDPLPSST